MNMRLLAGANLIRLSDGRWRVERNAGWGTLITFHNDLVEAWLVGTSTV